MEFRQKVAGKMHVDINSCFATIEQQANPGWRGKPVAVAAYVNDFGCVLAASYEAKRFGVKTGMRVGEAKGLIPSLIVCGPDPEKYRDVHRRMTELLGSYTDQCAAKSIDEFVLDFAETVWIGKSLIVVGQEIKNRIKQEIGEWITVSIGIAPSRWLAKVASNLQKPDGLEMVDWTNIEQVYAKLRLMDLPGISGANARRLNRMGIYTVTEFYRASLDRLYGVFESVLARDWYLRLRGLEVDEVEFERRSYGNSFVLPEVLRKREEILPVLSKLVQKMAFRLRKGGFAASGMWLGVGLRPIRWDMRRDDFWHRGRSLGRTVFASEELYWEAVKLLDLSPFGLGVKSLAVSCFGLERREVLQLRLFEDITRSYQLTAALDQVNRRWGAFTIRPARMLDQEKYVFDRIAFGGVKELSEIES